MRHPRGWEDTLWGIYYGVFVMLEIIVKSIRVDIVGWMEGGWDMGK